MASYVTEDQGPVLITAEQRAGQMLLQPAHQRPPLAHRYAIEYLGGQDPDSVRYDLEQYAHLVEGCPFADRDRKVDGYAVAYFLDHFRKTLKLPKCSKPTGKGTTKKRGNQTTPEHDGG